MDVFHVREHLHACGRVLYGDQTPEARRWAEPRLETVLASGPMVLLRELEQVRTEVNDAAQGEALDSLTAYLQPNILYGAQWDAYRTEKAA